MPELSCQPHTLLNHLTLEVIGLARSIHEGGAAALALLLHVSPCMHSSQVICTAAAGPLVQRLSAHVASSTVCPAQVWRK